MVSIIKFQNSCKINDLDDEDILQDLDKDLSYKIMGSEFSSAYKGHVNEFGEFVSWDGCRHLLSPNGKFPIGLLPRVLEFLFSRNIIPDIIDNRPEKTPTNEIDISERLKEIGMIPRPYQAEIVEEAIKYERGIIRAATGAGKALIIAMITAKLGKPTTVFVIGTDLLYQLHKLFSNVFQTEIGIIGDGNCEIHDINIASVWTVGKVLGVKDTSVLDDESEKEIEVSRDKYKNIKQMLLSSKVIQLDECHLASCDTVQAIANNIKAEHVFGLSASPWRDDNSEILIESALGRQIVDLSARKLIEQGYLVRPIIRFLAPAPYPYKTGKYPKIYCKYITENEQRNGMVVQAVVKLIEQGFIPLVLFNSIKHGDILFKLLKDKIPTALLSGKDKSKKREQIKQDITDGKIKCIIASRIFEIGVDLPIVSGLVLAGAGKSSVRSLQRIGRVIRKYPGKKIAAVIDFADQAKYLVDHAEARRKIYEMEFDDVQWPKEKKTN